MSEIRTQWLREVHEFEKGVMKYHELYKTNRDESSLSKMYINLRGMLYKMVANYRTVDDVVNSIDYLVNELSNEVITKIIKNPDFKVYAWHSYLKLSLLHVRDDYYRHHNPQIVQVDNIESVSFSWANPDWIENRSDNGTGESAMDLYARSKIKNLLFDSSIKTESDESRITTNVVNSMNDITKISLDMVSKFKDVRVNSPLYYRNCIRMLSKIDNFDTRLLKECEEVVSREYR